MTIRVLLNLNSKRKVGATAPAGFAVFQVADQSLAYQTFSVMDQSGVYQTFVIK